MHKRYFFMSITLLIKAKAWLTIALGSVFLFLPAQLMSAMGGELTDAGTIMAQLFGLIAMAIGWGMLVSGHPAPVGTDALAVVLTDSVAVYLLILATNRGVFAGPGYGLAAVYAGSAVLYLYFYMYDRNAQRAPTQDDSHT
jgi:hypothetical protein